MPLERYLLPMALCADAVAKDGGLVGDPTEGALVVLAAKGGVDPVLTREKYPRIAEVPFDAAYKFMATFHRMTDENGRDVIRCYVKGAPDQLLARASGAIQADGSVTPITGDGKDRYMAENQRLGEQGLRHWRRPIATSIPPRSTRKRRTCCRSSPTSRCWRWSASSTRPGRRHVTRSPRPRRPASRRRMITGDTP